MSARRAVEEALHLANRAHRLAVECGDQPLARALAWEARRWQEHQTTVVVAGEVDRGKSSVLNALLDRPGLLPAGEGSTTSQVVVRHAIPEYVRITRRSPDESIRVEEVDAAQLADLVTDLGDPEARSAVVAVEVGVGSELLGGGLVLVDTPGIGAMTPGHRESALRAASSADLLLVVLAADEPVLRSELDFVLDASERVGSVLFVMNRVDLNPDWDDMRREHRDRIWRAAQDRRAKQNADESNAGDLARQAERLDALGDAAMLPVSARLATRAATRGNTDLADRSGIEQVRQLLADLAARRDELRARNLVRLVDSCVRRLETTQEMVVTAATESAGRAPAALEADLAALGQELNASARWRRTVRVGGQRLQATAGAEVAKRIDALELAYRDHLGTLSTSELAAAAETIADDLERSVGALCADLTEWLSDRADIEFAGLRDEIGEATVQAIGIDTPAVDVRSLGSAATDVSGDAHSRAGCALVTQSWVLGNMAGAFLGVAAGGWVVLPIGAAVMAPIAVIRHRRKQLAKSRQELGRSVRETLSAVRRRSRQH